MTLAATLQFKPGSPCCPCTPANLPAYLPWHTVASHTIHVVRVSIDAYPAYTTGGCDLPQAWLDFADGINVNGSLRGVVLFADTPDQLSRPAAADGFAVQLELAAGFFGATGYRRMQRLTISRGTDSIVYEYDAGSDRLIRNDELTTLSLCLNLQFRTYLFPRLFTAAEYDAGAGVYTTTITLSGFGGHGDCTNLNGINGVTKRTFVVILGGGVVVDGYVFYGIFHDSVVKNYPTYVAGGTMEMFTRNSAALGIPVGVPFPLFSTGPVSPASFGYVGMSVQSIPAGSNHSAGFYLRFDHGRYPTAAFTASDFVYSGKATGGGPVCPVVGTLDNVTETIT